VFDLQRDGDVFILRFDDHENRLSPSFLDGIDEALDTVDKAGGPRALVTVGTGRFYSNGLDLDWLGANGDRTAAYIGRIHGLFARLLSLPLPTVAAINGHAFAAGAMLALAHDVAVMRTGRGYVCLPEVDLGMSFPSGMNALLRARLPAATAHEAMITGRRYTAEEALGAGIVGHTAAEEQVLPTALGIAAGLAPKSGTAMGRIRTDLYQPVMEALARPAF
jgi:enoyl-CoA hydratase/carnithine racemase